MERILIVSDPHFGKFFDLKFGSPSGLKSQIVDALNRDKKKPDFIVCPGDLTSVGFTEEFKEAKDFLNGLISDFSLTNRDLLTLVGNHDVNREVYKLLQKNKDIGLVEQEVRHLATQVQSFHYWHSFDIIGPCFGSGLMRRDKYNIIALNSSWNCIDEDARHGSIGTSQLEWLQNVSNSQDSKLPTIVTLHHHPEVLPYPLPIKSFIKDLSQVIEGAELMEIFDNLDLRLIIHGHRHHPVLASLLTKGRNQKLVPILCAGSVGVHGPKRLSDIPNFFHILEFDPESEYSDVITYNSTARGVWTSTYSEAIHQTISPRQAISTKHSSIYNENLHLSAVGSLWNSNSKITYEKLPPALKCLNRETILKALEKYAEVNHLELCGDYLDPRGMVYLTKS